MTQPPRFNLPQTMQEAVALHQQGRLREAEKLYARVLKAEPEHFDALHLLGLAKAQGGQMGEASRLMSDKGCHSRASKCGAKKLALICRTARRSEVRRGNVCWITLHQ
jgi:thioredoxin-like negative regulator of GroEL